MPKRGRNQGRHPASAYRGAKVVRQAVEGLYAGQVCPCPQRGMLHALSPGKVIRITGGRLAEATCYELARLRCGRCGEIFKASLPPEAGCEKYSASFKSSLAVYKYYLGLPFYRMAHYQQLIGIPLPDATQWPLVEQVAGSAIAVFQALVRRLAQSPLIHSDDTRVRILAVFKESSSNAKRQGSKAERRGTYTTGLLGYDEGHTIYVFLSGVQHAGEKMQEVLAQRAKGLAPPIHMADASSMNAMQEGQVLVARCLAHGVRKFIELDPLFPEISSVVLEKLSRVYEIERKSQAQQLSADERLAYHKEHSLPVMASLQAFLVKGLKDHEIEPNSALGQAARYLLKHWEGLTAFLRWPGAPLDNNRLEGALKVPIRLRKNALFYRTTYGGWVGSVLTSLIHTCVTEGQDPVAYLTALQIHQEAVIRDPLAYLPWTYQATLESTVGSRLAA